MCGTTLRLSLLSALLLVQAACWAAGAAEPGTPQLKVTYTGRLFGYYRMEAPEQDMTTGRPTSIVLAPVRAFLETVPGTNLEPQGQEIPNLLLGMGDNFGPEFGAGIQLDSNGCPPLALNSEQYPRALYKMSTRVASVAGCDNVVHFLEKAGYRAVVPGREDFIYSATWLNKIAYLLKKDVPPTATPLNMLAANLRVQFPISDASDSSKEPIPLCPLALEENLAPLDADTLRDRPLEKARWGCRSEDSVNLKDLDKHPSQLEAIREEQRDLGYTEAQLPGGSQVLLIGVIGPDTINSVSSENLKLSAEARDGKATACVDLQKEEVATDRCGQGALKGKVVATDPVKAVAEILIATNCKKYSYRILMAQMTRAEAEQLAAKLRALADLDNFPPLDLVISEAQDGGGSRKFSFTQYGLDGSGHWNDTPVVTPASGYDSEKRRLVRPDWTATLSPASEKESSRTISTSHSSSVADWDQVRRPPAEPGASCVSRSKRLERGR